MPKANAMADGEEQHKKTDQIQNEQVLNEFPDGDSHLSFVAL